MVAIVAPGHLESLGRAAIAKSGRVMYRSSFEWSTNFPGRMSALSAFSSLRRLFQQNEVVLQNVLFRKIVHKGIRNLLKC